jgi:hypothetical protein
MQDGMSDGTNPEGIIADTGRWDFTFTDIAQFIIRGYAVRASVSVSCTTGGFMYLSIAAKDLFAAGANQMLNYAGQGASAATTYLEAHVDSADFDGVGATPKICASFSGSRSATFCSWVIEIYPGRNYTPPVMALLTVGEPPYKVESKSDDSKKIDDDEVLDVVVCQSCGSYICR